MSQCRRLAPSCLYFDDHTRRKTCLLGPLVLLPSWFSARGNLLSIKAPCRMACVTKIWLLNLSCDLFCSSYFREWVFSSDYAHLQRSRYCLLSIVSTSLFFVVVFFVYMYVNQVLVRVNQAVVLGRDRSANVCLWMTLKFRTDRVSLYFQFDVFAYIFNTLELPPPGGRGTDVLSLINNLNPCVTLKKGTNWNCLTLPNCA